MSHCFPQNLDLVPTGMSQLDHNACIISDPAQINSGGSRRPGRRFASVQRQEAGNFPRLQVTADGANHTARARRGVGHRERQGKRE